MIKITIDYGSRLKKREFQVGFDVARPIERLLFATTRDTHARWKVAELEDEYRCSHCGAEFRCEDMDFEFCPRCGAKMDSTCKNCIDYMSHNGHCEICHDMSMYKERKNEQ